MRHNIENGINKEYIHVPVMWREIVSFVEKSNLSGKGIFVSLAANEVVMPNPIINTKTKIFLNTIALNCLHKLGNFTYSAI